MYDALQTVKLQPQLQIGECWYRALLPRVPKFVLQLAVFFRSYHSHDREFEAWSYHDLGDAVPRYKCSRTRNRAILECARSTIRGPTWRFHQPHHKALPYRHALIWKNSLLLKTLTEHTTATNWYMIGPYRVFARLHWNHECFVLIMRFIELVYNTEVFIKKKPEGRCRVADTQTLFITLLEIRAVLNSAFWMFKSIRVT